jgi:hypothetical protein
LRLFAAVAESAFDHFGIEPFHKRSVSLG